MQKKFFMCMQQIFKICMYSMIGKIKIFTHSFLDVQGFCTELAYEYTQVVYLFLIFREVAIDLSKEE